MSRYTTEVRYICETAAGLDESVGYLNIEQVIKNSLVKIFDFDFPIFDEKYRSVLETKILRHYYTREIAHETVGLWKLKLCTKLNEIMPYYNQLYKSELISFNPMYDVDLTRERKVDSSGTRDTSTRSNTDTDTSGSVNRTNDVSLKNDTTNTDNSTTTGSGSKKQMYSDTPQGAITDLEAGKYLTNATIDNTSNTDTTIGNGTGTQTGSTNTKEETGNNTTSSTDASSTSNTDITNLENYIETVKGKQGAQSYTSLLKEFRETFLNIDMMIIDDLSELFFGLWA
nr:MAG: hypothetical protein [Bacteriophage sp.]